MRRLAWLALACALANPALADTAQASRPYTIDDMLSLQKAGRAVFSGDGKTLVFEIQGPLTQAGRWDMEFFSIKRTGRLYVVDVEAGGGPKPLLASQAGVGESLGALSPDGRRAIIYRLRGHTNELGIVDLATRKVRWSGRSVDLEDWFSLARWRSDSEVVALTTTPQTPSFVLNRGWQTQARTIAGWEAADAGKVSVLALNSGPDASQNPAWPDVDLVAFDAVSGKVRALARGPFQQLTVSPDGRTAALPMAMEYVTIDADSPVRNDAFSRRRRLALVDLTSGRTQRPCGGCDLASMAINWAPDGRALLLAARPDTAKAGDWRDVRYWRVTTDGQSDKLSSDLQPGMIPTIGGANLALRPDAAWLGDVPAVLARRAGEDKVGWWKITSEGPVALLPNLTADAGLKLTTTRAGFLLRVPTGLMAVDAEGARLVAGAPARVVATPAMAGDAPDIVQVEETGGVRAMMRDGREAACAPTPPGASLLALAPTTGSTFALLKAPNGVARLLLTQRGHAARLLMAINQHLEDVAVAAPRPISHLNPRGETVTSWLYLPQDHRPSDERPLIVTQYPGANYTAPPWADGPDQHNFTLNVQTMVGQGYAVLAASLPIPATADPSSGLADAILASVDAALAADKGLSRTRLAVWGHSFGGYGALMAATQSSRFKAVLSSSGIANLFSMYGELGHQAYGAPEVLLHPPGMFGWSETGQGRMLDPPWARPYRYLAASPLLHADKIVAPVLLLQGDLDVGGRQSLEMFSALYRQGKPATLLYYRGEGHVVQSPDNVRDYYRRAFAFLQAALSDTKVAQAPRVSAPAAPARASQ